MEYMSITNSSGGYAWLITKDCVGCKGYWNDPEPGDWNSTLMWLSLDEIRSSERRQCLELILHAASCSGKRFSMYDDDGGLCYEGVFVGDDDATGFEPLEEFGMPNAGCTEIRYHNPKTGKMERL